MPRDETASRRRVIEEVGRATAPATAGDRYARHSGVWRLLTPIGWDASIATGADAAVAAFAAVVADVASLVSEAPLRVEQFQAPGGTLKALTLSRGTRKWTVARQGAEWLVATVPRRGHPSRTVSPQTQRQITGLHATILSDVKQVRRDSRRERDTRDQYVNRVRRDLVQKHLANRSADFKARAAAELAALAPSRQADYIVRAALYVPASRVRSARRTLKRRIANSGR